MHLPTYGQGRASFMQFSHCHAPSNIQRALWEVKHNENHHHKKLSQTKENLQPGHRCDWKTWKSQNRLRIWMGQCKYNISKWGYTYTSGTDCDCKTAMQSISHLLRCPLVDDQFCLEGLVAANEKVLNCARAYYL